PKTPPKPIVREDVDPEQERLDLQLAETARYAGDDSDEKELAQDARQTLSQNLDELVEESQPLFSNYHVKAGFSPASFRRVGSEKDIGLKAQVTTSRVRELTFNYQFDSRRYRDQLSGIGFDYSQQKGDLTVDIVKLKDHISLFSYASYERRQQGEAYPLRAHINAGPIGIKYD